MNEKIALIILDGWGIGDGSKNDAVAQAKTPFMDSLLCKYPNATLKTSGEDVGLPKGQMGNSEVGHLNIGAGRIVYQELSRINRSIDSGEFFKNKTLNNAIDFAINNKKNIHLIGLVSNGGVHSSIEHLFALCDMAKNKNVKNLYIHAFTDGRDCDPKSGSAFIKKLENKIKNTPFKIASVIGRYYAMDRDNRWERIKKAYDLLTKAKGDVFKKASDAIDHSYQNGITDEFINPCVIEQENGEKAKITDGDVVICFNFRTDRPREITEALTQMEIPEHHMEPLNLTYLSFTEYNKKFKNIDVVFKKENIQKTLGEVLSENGKNQVRIAETEKYPHVTFFFNGGREKAFENEKRMLVNSPKVATYDLMPEMSAPEVRDNILSEINTRKPDFICLNFANPDMVGHTGVFNSIVSAVETVDSCLHAIVDAGQKQGYEFIIIADHGNADYAINPDGSPNTAHSLNPVPIVFVSEKPVKLKDGVLADIAPTILHLLNIKIPKEMSGKNLVKVN
ncbi:MAG: 2,3-bisphosphoglycerate-independent phosphoglycerate mutase [Crocinitomicaceae bacterium]|nr:2,3-bisphosphoglycerate-independent phosphoglycerate mutase [Crocinitomicaceae bacterium]